MAVVNTGGAHTASTSAGVLPGGLSFPAGVTASLAVETQIASAWQANDALRMSQALACAHAAGLSLTGALSLSLARSLCTPEETRQAKFNAMLSPEVRASFAEDGHPCLALYSRGGTYSWVGNCAFERLFGLGDRERASRSELLATFQRISHPEDVLLGLQLYEQALNDLLTAQNPQLVSVTTSTIRALPAGAARYDGYDETMLMQLPFANRSRGPPALDAPNVDVDDDSTVHTGVTKLTPLPLDVAVQRWRPSEMLKVTQPLFVVDDPPVGKEAYSLPWQPRLVRNLSKRRRNEDDDVVAVAAAPAACSFSACCAAASTAPCASSSVGFGAGESSTQSMALELRHDMAEEMTWSMQELIDLVSS